jgi:hypothetical protein
MPHARSTTPKWHPANLHEHHTKHAACFTDIKHLPAGAVSVGRYEIYADECYEHHWLRYEADCLHDKKPVYVGLRHYFVNDDLAVAITSLDEANYVTFFHEHFDHAHGVHPPRGASVGQRRLEYSKQLERDQESKKMRSFRILPNG